MTTAFTLGITLRDLPAIWCEVYIPADLSLARLHDVIQVLMGWEDRHLHSFTVDGVEYGTSSDDEDQTQSPLISDDQLTVGEALERGHRSFDYTDDFGDGWELSIEMKGTIESPNVGGVLCLAGAMAGPPEDCGGPHAYSELLTVWHSKGKRGLSPELRLWLPKRFEPDTFLLDEANERFRLMPPPVGPEPSEEIKLLDDVALTALYLGSWTERGNSRRAWKRIDFDALAPEVNHALLR